MPRFSLTAAGFECSDAVCASLHAHLGALEDDASVRQFITALAEHGLLALDPADDLARLCDAVRRGLELEPMLTATTEPFRHCFEEAVRAVLGATLLSEYHLLTPGYDKPQARLLAAPAISVHTGVQLRLVTGVCRVLARRDIVQPRDAASLGVHLFQSVRAKPCKFFAFEHMVFDDVSGIEHILHVLAHSITHYKDAPCALAALLVRVFFRLHRFVDAQFRAWLPTEQNVKVEAYRDKLLANMNTQTTYDMLHLCVGLQHPPHRLSLGQFGKYAAVLRILYPGSRIEDAFVPPQREPALCDGPDIFVVPSTQRTAAGPPVSVLVQAMVAWDLLFGPGFAVSSELQHAVAAEYICRIVMTVRGHGTFLECLA